jgi:hypothetical protein
MYLEDASIQNIHVKRLGGRGHAWDIGVGYHHCRMMGKMLKMLGDEESDGKVVWV